MKEKEHVKLNSGYRKKVLDMIDISYPTLTKALRFEYNSQKARKARLYAVNFLHQRVYISKSRFI